MRCSVIDTSQQCSDPLTDWLGRTAGRWTVLAWAPVLLIAYLVNAGPHLAASSLSAAVGVAAFFCATVAAVIASWARPLTYLLYAAQLALTVVLVWGPDGGWLPMVPLLSVAIGVVVPVRWAFGAIVAVSLTVAGSLMGQVAIGDFSASLVLTAALTTFLCGIGNHILLQLFATVGQLRATRHKLANTAVADERLRFSRDLHDLLGHTLSVIVVKGEAIRRLAVKDPEAASRHGADIESLGRTALAEVRDAVAGYRSFHLDDELQRAASSLREAGIEPTIDVGGRPGPTDELLACAIREAATNIIRHSRATSCAIRADVDSNGERRGIIVTDNGIGSTPGAEVITGSGLRGLSERIGSAGGTLTAGPAASGGFSLSVAVSGKTPDGATADLVNRR